MAIKKDDWCRIVMNDTTTKLIKTLSTENLDLLEISGKDWKVKSRAWWKSYSNTSFPEFDLCNPPPVTKTYDIVIAEQVFEHVRYPYRGLNTVKSLLNDGGYFLITTPFLIKVHGSPVDYWRWTEDGMRYFLEDGGFKVLDSGSWGNKECVKTYLDFETMGDYNSSTCSLENEKDFIIMVWALAQKI